MTTSEPTDSQPNSIATILSKIIDPCLASLAAQTGGVVTPAGSWFDGFWDFFVENQARIRSATSREVQGSGWAFLFFLEEAQPDVAFEVCLFVECKQRNSRARAPWPVCSTAAGGEPARIGEKGIAVRTGSPEDAVLADRLRDLGFDVDIGYWGLRVQQTVASHTAGSLRIEQVFGTLPKALKIAVELGRGLNGR